jgi:hypothetical protein
VAAPIDRTRARNAHHASGAARSLLKLAKQDGSLPVTQRNTHNFSPMLGDHSLSNPAWIWPFVARQHLSCGVAAIISKI